MRKAIVRKNQHFAYMVCLSFAPIVIEYEIKLKSDPDGVLSYETIVAIFDKRQVIRGIKRMKYDFKVKRRKLLSEQNEA